VRVPYLAARAADEKEPCPAGRNPSLVLPHARQSMALTGQLEIVALGSSSTQGWMSSSPTHTYPALLQDDLATLFPNVQVNVLNRGIGGQDAAEEIQRLESDAIAPKPSIVIWQVGANGAMGHRDPEIFKRLLRTGIGRMKAAGIDVVLMDNQRSPAVLASPEHLRIEADMADLAQEQKVQLFSRGSLMDQWRAHGAAYDLFVSPDHVHHNDYGYRCVASALAESMAEGLRGDADAKN
jgi:acyl-CoA thioesterase-1